jgi:uncharacterized protein with PQ loop repeat
MEYNIEFISRVIAGLAVVLSTIQVIPQLYKVHVRKQVRDLSLETIGLGLFSSFVWAAHGYLISDFTLIMSSTTVAFLQTMLMTMYFMYV